MIAVRKAKVPRTKKTDAAPPRIEVRTAILSECNNDLAGYLSDALSSGWKLMSGPTFIHRGEPRGMNGYAVGFDWPHFVVVVKERDWTTSGRYRSMIASLRSRNDGSSISRWSASATGYGPDK